MIAKVVTGLARLSDAELDARTQAIIAAMTGNTNFATPQPALQTIGDALKAFQDAAAEAQTGSKAARARRITKKAELLQLLNELAAYVQLNCKGDVAIILSSGFTARKSPQSTPEIDAPSALVVEITQVPGRVKISVNKVDGAALYFFEYRRASATDGQWTVHYSTTRTITADGLDSRQDYVFRAGVNDGGPVKYSPELVQFVL